MENVAPPGLEGSPTPLEVLRWCASVAPAVWFPSVHCQNHNLPRAKLDEPLWTLRQAELIQVSDWVKGRGQGFTVTAIGQEILRVPNPKLDWEAIKRRAAEPEDEDGSAAEVATIAPTKHEPTHYDRGEATRQAFLGPVNPVITRVFLTLNLLWFLGGWGLALRNNLTSQDYLSQPSASFLVEIGAAFGPYIYKGEWWRLMSSAFVHVGLLHLLLNSLALYTIGPIVESIWGRWRVVVIYLLSALGGSCLAMSLNPITALAGASGAIWGLIAAILVWLIRYRSHLPPDVAADSLRRFLFVVGFNALLSFAPNISWEGHLGGAIVGVATSFWLNTYSVASLRRPKYLTGLGLVAILLATMGFLVAMMRYSSRWQPVRDPQVQVVVPFTQDEFKELIETVSLPRVASLHQESLAAMITRTPANIAQARERSLALNKATLILAAQLTQSSEPPALRYAEYLKQVQEFNHQLAQQLILERLPTSEESQRLGEQRRKVEEAWQALLQSHARP